MDTTIRNLDPQTYRALRARAVAEGRTVGDVLNEAIRKYLAGVSVPRAKASLRALRPEPYTAEDAQLSSRIDSIVYSAER